MDEKVGQTNILPAFGTLELCLAPASNATVESEDDRLCPVVDRSDDAKLVVLLLLLLYLQYSSTIRQYLFETLRLPQHWPIPAPINASCLSSSHYSRH